MTQLMIAQRGYQANLSVIDRARDVYLQALSLGK
jgi:flagellar basal-body rod protein FlgC